MYNRRPINISSVFQEMENFVSDAYDMIRSEKIFEACCVMELQEPLLSIWTNMLEHTIQAWHDYAGNESLSHRDQIWFQIGAETLSLHLINTTLIESQKGQLWEWTLSYIDIYWIRGAIEWFLKIYPFHPECGYLQRTSMELEQIHRHLIPLLGTIFVEREAEKKRGRKT